MRTLAALALAMLPLAPLLVPPALAADAARGADLYDSRCGGCHSIETSRIGPMHRGVVGRTAGSAGDFFDYSDALKASGITWTEANLDRWLTDPQALVPGQKMNFRVGLPEDRADIIAYLKSNPAP